MINKINRFFYSIKTGKVKINSIAKSIKTIRLKENSWIIALNDECTSGKKHLNYCIKSAKTEPIALLKKISGKHQIKEMQEKTELGKQKTCVLVVFSENRKELVSAGKKACKELGFTEIKGLLNSKNRLEKIRKNEKLTKNQLKGFGEDFYSSMDNFFIERSALVVE